MEKFINKLNLLNIVTWIFILFFVGLNVLTLKDGHNWGEDFSQYIIHAKNILDFRPYYAGVMVEPIVVYPPGFPLLLAPIIKIFGVNFQILKSLNIIFWFLALFLIKRLLNRQVLSFDQSLLFFLLAASSSFFVFKQNILSDIPFYFFVLISLCKLKEFDGNIVSFKGGVLLLCLSFAFLLRSAGVILFIVALIDFLIRRKNYRNVFMLILVFILIVLIQHLIIGTHIGRMDVFVVNPIAFIRSAFDSSSILFRSILYFVCPTQTIFSSAVFNGIDRLMPVLSVFIYMAIAWAFIIKLKNKNFDILDLFLFVYLCLMVFWAGYPHPPDAFYRFVLPLAVVGLIKLLNVLSGIWLKVIRGFLIVLIGINIYNIGLNYNFNDDVLLKRENQEMFSWVKGYIKENEAYMTWSSRVVALMTSRVGTVPYWGRDNNVFDRVKRFQIKYFILSKSLDLALIQDFHRFNTGFSKVWENDGFEIWSSDTHTDPTKLSNPSN